MTKAVPIASTYHDIQIVTCISSAVFYYLLANLSPQYRSSLQNIQLVTLARTQDVARYGVDKILEPYTEDIKQLEKVSLIILITVESHII